MEGKSNREIARKVDDEEKNQWRKERNGKIEKARE